MGVYRRKDDKEMAYRWVTCGDWQLFQTGKKTCHSIARTASYGELHMWVGVLSGVLIALPGA